MSLLTELFGQEALNDTLEEVKKKINSLPPSLKEKKTYLLHEFAILTGIFLKEEDYREVGD